MIDNIVAFLTNLLDTAGFPPRWKAGSWSTLHGWLQIASDLTVWFACLMMALVLARLMRKRSGISCRSVGWLFAAFIIACGSVYLLDALMFWWPAYRLLGLFKIITAITSLVAIAMFIPLFPKALALRSPTELQREIDQRRRTESELRQVHAQLEGVIEQRTAELAAKNEEMEQFLNTVSHDLKNPIVTCLGLTGILREDIQSNHLDETTDTIDRIDRTVTRMRHLIEDLLHLSRMGQIRFEPVEVDLSQVIRSIGEELKPRLEEIGAAFVIESDLPRVRADERLLTEVFENLITNAMKYGCDNAQPQIRVGSVVQNGEYHIYVRDNGRGISKAHHAQVFEPFRRLRTDREGTGMGLAIVVRVLKMHGGRVWIESEIGQGATFWIALPARTATESKKDIEHFVDQNIEKPLAGVFHDANAGSTSASR